MTLMLPKQAICPKCKTEQSYQLLLSWNNFCGTLIPDNKCVNCGHQLIRDDITDEDFLNSINNINQLNFKDIPIDFEKSNTVSKEELERLKEMIKKSGEDVLKKFKERLK